MACFGYGPTRILLVTALILLCGPVTAPEFLIASPQHADVRRRSNQGTRSAVLRRSAAAIQNAASQFGGDLIPTLDEDGRLRSLTRRGRPLSPPDRRDAEVVAREFAHSHGTLLDLDDEWTRNLELVSRDRSGPNNLLRFRQQWGGVPVFQSYLRIHVSPAGEVMELDFRLEPLALPSIPEPASLILAPQTALLRALDELAGTQGPAQVEIREPARGLRRRTRLRLQLQNSGDDITARWTWFPVADRLRLSWEFDAVSLDSQTYYECVVDALDGSLLYLETITDSDVTGLVFSTSSPRPSATPGILPPTPDPPDIAPRILKSFSGDPEASPAGWVGPEQETAGNNVIAREDKAGDNETTLGLTARAVDGSFLFDLLLGPDAPSPVNFTDASITNLFYWCNLAHDYFYRLGFTEAAGNFQEDNFGRGGTGQDPLRADAQDGIDRNPPYLSNANMSTPSEGTSPRMQMFLWGSLGGPYVDSSLDAEVILHEFTHGVFRRLTGGGSQVQSGALNEGNSDFLALNYLIPEGAPLDGAYPAASFSGQKFKTGIRTHPYSTNLAVNDLSYADFGRVKGYPEVHADGEIWVEAMWELRARLMKKLGYQQGRERVATLMINALKRSSSSPSFVEMRDALISADETDFGGVDVALIWEAFARRGIGYMAIGESGASHTVLPSWDLPSPKGKVRFSEDVYFAGETVAVYLGDGNQADTVLHLTITTSSGDIEQLELARSGTLYRGTISTQAGTAAPDDLTLQVATGDVVRLEYPDPDDGSGSPQISAAECVIHAPYKLAWLSGSLEPAEETPLVLKGDNVTRSYSLPFGFPFFNRLVREVQISTNGLITIEFPYSSGSNSESAFRNYAAIAPLWDDLRTNGNTVTDEDVYVAFPTPDSIRFRWIGETVKRNGGILVPGNPVDFAATLYRSGNIIFTYVSGNESLTPTAGISRGNQSFSQVFSGFNIPGTISIANSHIMRWSYQGEPPRTTVFPYLEETERDYTGFAVLNLDDKPGDVLFTARRDDGGSFAATDPAALYLTPGAQEARVGREIFPGLPAESGGWVEASWTGARLAAFFLTGNYDQTYLGGAPAAAKPGQELVFTDVPGNAADPAEAVLCLVNPSSQDVHVELAWHDVAGAAVLSAERLLGPKSRLKAEVVSLFPVPDDFQGGYLRIAADSGVAGVVVLRNNGDPRIIASQESSTDEKLYAAQFASGDRAAVVYETYVDVVNSSDASREISLELLGNEGQPVQFLGMTNPVHVTLGPGAQLHQRGDRLFGLPDATAAGRYFEGTLVLTADGPGLVGSITFGDAQSHRFTSVLPLAPATDENLVFPQVAEGQAGDGKPYFTGVALFNPNESQLTARIRIFTRRGIPAGTADVPLGPLQRISRTLGELIPGIKQIGGYIRITTTGGPVAAFAVYGDSALDFLVALPPQGVGRN